MVEGQARTPGGPGVQGAWAWQDQKDGAAALGGLAMALWSGAALAGALREVEPARAQRVYERAYRARLRWRRPACLLAAMALERPRVVRAVWPLMERRRGALRSIVQ